MTRAGYGHQVGFPIAYGWLSAALAIIDVSRGIRYFDQTLAASVAADPLYDPQMVRLKV